MKYQVATEAEAITITAIKKQAKCYNQLGWWKFYRTEEGHSFTVRDNKDYWYNGNVYSNDRTGECFIEKQHHTELFKKIEFIG